MPQTDPHTQYISIFPRGRHRYASKNLDARQWEVVLQALPNQSSLPIVVHGVKAEMTPIPRAEKFIHPKGVLEQVFYLNQSRFCVSPDSGFVQFALNCGCDVFVIGGTIQYHEFAGFNPFGRRLVIASMDPREFLPALKEFAAMGSK
jgi:ADP-heptose:LPS heptosyltransferase